MDFASGLANLEQAAANSQNRRRGRDNNSSSNHYGGGGEDSRRYQPRPRHHDNRRDNNYRRHHSHHHHHRPNQYDRDLDALARFGYRLPRSPYSRPSPISASKMDRPFHICLLAITIDDLPYEDIWKAWAADTDNKRYKVSLVCHAKFPDKVQSEWLKQRMLLQPRRIVRGNSLSDPEYLTHKPAWGSVEITRAMVDLLVQGMEIGRPPSSTASANNPDNDPRFLPNRFYLGSSSEEIPTADKFIFISETCVPVTTLDECMKALFVTTKQPSKPRWEPPPGKEVVPAAAENKSDAENKKAEDEEKEGGKQEQDGDKKQQDAAAAVDNKEKPEGHTAPKGVPTLADLPINKVALPDEEIIHLDTSWVNARNFNSPNTPSNKYERDQFSMISRVVPKRYRWKADQWMVLSRTHANAVLDIDRSSNIPPKDQLWNSFKRINASDEMYFPTALSLAGVLVDNNRNSNANGPLPSMNNDATPWLERRRVTYTDWSMGMRNPASFTKGIKDFANVARLARQQKTLFARKFCPYLEIPGQDPSSIERTGDITVEEWKKELEAIRQQEQQQQGEGADTKKEGEEEEEEKPAAEEISGTAS